MRPLTFFALLTFGVSLALAVVGLALAPVGSTSRLAAGGEPGYIS